MLDVFEKNNESMAIKNKLFAGVLKKAMRKGRTRWDSQSHQDTRSPVMIEVLSRKTVSAQRLKIRSIAFVPLSDPRMDTQKNRRRMLGIIPRGMIELGNVSRGDVRRDVETPVCWAVSGFRTMWSFCL